MSNPEQLGTCRKNGHFGPHVLSPECIEFSPVRQERAAQPRKLSALRDCICPTEMDGPAYSLRVLPDCPWHNSPIESTAQPSGEVERPSKPFQSLECKCRVEVVPVRESREIVSTDCPVHRSPFAESSNTYHTYDTSGEVERPADKRPPMPKNFSWFSVCSGCAGMKMAGGYNPDCANCNAGRWINDELHEFTSWLFKENPALWRKWANRETTPDQPGHGARHFLESVFPGLRRKSKLTERVEAGAPVHTCSECGAPMVSNAKEFKCPSCGNGTAPTEAGAQPDADAIATKYANLVLMSKQTDCVTGKWPDPSFVHGCFQEALAEAGRARSGSSPELPVLEIYQQDWSPGWASFLEDGSIAEGAKAHATLNLGSCLVAVETGELPAKDMPYLVAESLMHEAIHALESWAKVEFSEERVEELLEQYRAKYRPADEAHWQAGGENVRDNSNQFSKIPGKLDALGCKPFAPSSTGAAE